MADFLARSVNSVAIRLTEERWRHIVQRHPQLADNQDVILEVITSPEAIYQGEKGSLVAMRTAGNLYLVVVYRELSASDGFVITAYETRRLKAMDIMWQR